MVRKLVTNFHTHSIYCNHAYGSIREYVETAVGAGLESIGFSCHAPYVFHNGFYSWYRMTLDQQKLYVKEICEAKEAYRGKIEVYIGYEAEYYPELFGELLFNITSLPCDYLIIGQHFLNNEYDGQYTGDHTGDIADVRRYVDQVTCAMKTGIVTFVAHPDLMMYSGDEKDYLDVMKDICICSLETDTPLELNLTGLRENRGYPKEPFLEMAGSYGCKYVLGSDAHQPGELVVDKAVEEAFELIDKYHLNYIERPELKKVRTL